MNLAEEDVGQKMNSEGSGSSARSISGKISTPPIISWSKVVDSPSIHEGLDPSAYVCNGANVKITMEDVKDEIDF